MQRITVAASLVLTFLVCTTAPVRAQDEREDARIQQLEKQVAALRATVSTLERSVGKEEIVGRRQVDARVERSARGGAATPTIESQLEQVQEALQALAARVDDMEDELEAASEMVGFHEQGNALVLDHPGDVQIKAGAALRLESNSAARLEAGANLELRGALVKLNGGGKPLARMGDGVIVNTASGQGSVTTGTTTVLVP